MCHKILWHVYQVSSKYNKKRSTLRAAFAIETSENTKLGPVSATYTGQQSCPTDCPLYQNGCYAEYGPLGWLTRRLNRAPPQTPAQTAREEAAAIDTLTGDRPLRLHVVGDARTDTAARVLGAACTRYARRGTIPHSGRKAWTYTHAWRQVSRKSWGPDVAVLASCETTVDARKAMRKGYAAALIVASFPSEAAYTRDGLKLLPCPWQTRKVRCRECRLCWDDDRLRKSGIVIAFRAHGVRAGTVRQTLLSLETV